MNELAVKIVAAAVAAAALAVCCTINSDLGREVIRLCDSNRNDI